MLLCKRTLGDLSTFELLLKRLLLVFALLGYGDLNLVQEVVHHCPVVEEEVLELVSLVGLEAVLLERRLGLLLRSAPEEIP